MTLDGHVKVGLSAMVATCFLVPAWLPDMDVWMLFILAVSVMIGNVFPDFSEMNVIPHRTFTHYWPMYTAVLWFFVPSLSDNTASVYAVVAVGLSMGSLLHIACDWPYYGGCPLFTPRRKVAFLRLTFDGGLNRTVEYSTVLLVLAVCAWQLMPEQSVNVDVQALFSSQK